MKAEIKNNVLTINTGVTKAAMKAAASKDAYTLRNEKGEPVFMFKVGAEGNIDNLSLTANSVGAGGELVAVIIGTPETTSAKMKEQYGKVIATAKPHVEAIAVALKDTAKAIDESVTVVSEGEDA